jgi:hypothetical protein
MKGNKMRRVLLVLGMAITAVVLSVTPALAQAAAGTITINSAVILSPFQMRVTGTVECVEGSQYNLFFVNVKQQGPQQSTVNGYGATQGSCTATGPQTWTTTVQADNRTFNPGKTFVRVDGTVCDPSSNCSPGTAELTLQVKRG